MLLTKGAARGRPGTPLAPKGIVVHYVGNPGSSAAANRNYFESGSEGRGVSSHYIVGLDGEIIRCVPENEVAYHATTANSTHIGIENCHPDAAGKFNDKTYASLISLCADICTRYGIKPETGVIRHYDVSGKLCPLYYVNNPAAWKTLVGDIAAKIAPVMSPEEITVDNAISDGVVSDRAYWLGVIRGTITPDREYIKIILDNAHVKIHA